MNLANLCIKDKIFYAAVFCSLLLLRCSSNNGSAAIDESSSTISISSSLSYGKAALASAGNSTNKANTFGLSSSLAAIAASSEGTSNDPNCTNMGNAIINGSSNKMAADNPEYPFKQLYCKMTFNSYSPETLIGFLDMWGSIVCGMEKALGTFNWETSPSPQSSVNVAVEAGSCFSETLATNLLEGISSPVPIQNLKLYQLDGTTGYDYKMTFSVSTGTTTNLEVQFRSDSNYLGFHVKETQPTNNAKTTYTIITIDRANQQLRFQQGQTDDQGEGEFQQLLIKGTINSATGVLTSVTESQGYYIYLSGVNDEWSEYGSLKSLGNGNVKGNSAKQVSGTVTNGATNNSGIPLTDSDLDTFYTNRATLTNNMASANLLSFDNVALTTTVTSITGR